MEEILENQSLEPKKNESFEAKVELLNAMLEKLKDENLSLDESVKVYKNSIKLLNETREILDRAKLEIREIDE